MVTMGNAVTRLDCYSVTALIFLFQEFPGGFPVDFMNLVFGSRMGRRLTNCLE
jgi:hypothetical protein